ncbi:bacteriophage abortive infection AbiH family protein [Sphingomonas sp.]|uniref:bacteriophage abortive infection AbiH family protein n=1 Tax=Sphingomonas sp. TaxID=28214 RepID=UPI002DD68D41|nr:bacteriophage abortive infection AbiH family protein [Sphingomonas sp.]
MTHADLFRTVAAPTRLYVIGNGFDRYHGIPSDFRDFARYLAAADPTVYRMVGEYFSADARFWADFETCLAEFDQDQAVDYASQFLDDEGYGDFQYELEQIATGLSSGLRGRFAEWVRGLPIPQRGTVGRPLNVDPTAVFLSFNYTPTLEQIYGVARERILHIHGDAADPASELVLGHGWSRAPEDSLNFGPVGPDDDWRVRDGIEYIDQFFADTFKPTDKLLEENRPFFDGLAGLREILIMGHGMAEVDEPYFEEIMRRVDLASTRWIVSVFGDVEKRRERFGQYGIAPWLIEYRPLIDF